MSHVVKSFLNIAFFKTYSRNVWHMCHYSREVAKPTLVSGTDILMQNLKNATSTRSVLDLVSSHHTIMNNKHLIQALRALFTLQKYGNSDMSTQQILKHPEFEKMCQQLKVQAGLIELNETIEALKIMCFVGVSSDSIIVQVLMQLLRHNINELTLQQIIFLDFLVSNMKKTPLVEAMQIALPLVFEIQLQTKMDRDSITHLSDCLQYVSKKSVSDRCIESIVHSLLQCEQHMDGKTAYSIIWSICDMKPHEFFEPLLKKAIDAVIVEVDTLSYREMETTLSKMLYNYSGRMPFYYNEIICDICANYVIDNDLGFNHTIFLLRKLAKVNHSNDKLLNYISEKVLEEPNLILFGNPSLICSLLPSLTMTDFRPMHWEFLKNNLEQTTVFMNCTKKDILWMKTAALLCVLDIYKVEVLEKALNPDLLYSILQKRNLLDVENLLLIYQAIKTYKPEYAYLLPKYETINNAMSQLKLNTDYPLEMPLQKALGGETYIKTKLFSKMGHHIDHAVLFRKGGYPVAFSSSNKDTLFIDDIEKTPDSNLVIILGLGPHNYDLNTKRMKGNTSFSIRTLEAQHYTVVPICLEVWEALLEFEKIPYLMQVIKEKTDNFLRDVETCNNM